MGEASRPPIPLALTDAGLTGAVVIVTGGGSGIGARPRRASSAPWARRSCWSVGAKTC
jgi:hypothetical protein